MINSQTPLAHGRMQFLSPPFPQTAESPQKHSANNSENRTAAWHEAGVFARFLFNLRRKEKLAQRSVRKTDGFFAVDPSDQGGSLSLSDRPG